MRNSIHTLTFPWKRLDWGLPRAPERDAAPAHKVPRETYRNDARLVQACLDGDERAWHELVDRYQRLIYSIPRRYGLAPPDAEDVMQSVFVIVYRRLNTLRDQTRLSSWLIRITQRETFRLRQTSSPQVYELDHTIADFDAPLDEQMQWLELQHLVRQGLAHLDKTSRTLLQALLSDEPPSYEALAKQLGCPVGSIGPMRARSLKKLEAVLVEMGVDISW